MGFVVSVLIVWFPTGARAQDPFATRAAIISAEDRRAPTARDVATIRAGLRTRDLQTAVVAVRALGRLERPELIPDIVISLRHPDPEVREEAANAVAQAAEGFRKPTVAHGKPNRPTSGRGRGGQPLGAAIDPLVARLRVEADPSVRGALCESLGRLPFVSLDQIADAEREILGSLSRDDSIDSRLGAAAGFEALTRTARRLAADGPIQSDGGGGATAGDRLDDSAVIALKALVAVKRNEAVSAARVRRLAVEALTTAGAVDADTLRTASADPDAQVRRLAARAAGTGEIDAIRRSVLIAALHDESPLVRYEALRVFATIPADGGCGVALAAASDRDAHVALLALDTLGSCGWSTAAVDLLDRAVHDASASTSSRGWHSPAHALVALSTAAPARAAGMLPQFGASAIPWVRMYVARAATKLKDRALLERLAGDENDNVREAATAGLAKVAAHDADPTFVAQLDRADPQLLRTAAGALAGTPHPAAAVPALRAALQRLNAEGRETTRDAQTAIAETLRGLGVNVDLPRPVEELRPQSAVTAAELRRIQGARARITMRGIGTFDLALVATEAPASIIRFVHLVENGYYNGLTFHRVVPDFVIQGGSPGANEYAGDASYMRDEVGLWPHVRGAVGVSTRGHDTGDAQIFIDLVDNPRLDHVYTVFAQVLNGMNVVDQILEGDVIERIEIITA